MRMTPRVTLILKRAFSITRWHKNTGPEDDHDMVTGFQRGKVSLRPRHGDKSYKTFSQSPQHGHRISERENICGHDMVTGATEQIPNRHDMTGVHEGFTYCSPSTSSGKQNKNSSTSQPQFRSEIIPAKIEADQILLAPQQLANNNNSANFHNNVKIISKLPKSLTTTIPMIEGRSEKFEMLQDLFPTSFKIHNQLTEEDRINYFQCIMRGDAL